MRTKQPTIDDIYMADAFITTPGVRQGLLERSADGDDDEIVTEETDDGPVVYYRTPYGEMIPVGSPIMLAAGPSETVTDAGAGMRIGRGGVKLKPPSISDITAPAQGMADMLAATGKGLVQGFVGLPGDLESLVYGIKEIFSRGAGEGKLDAFLRGVQSGTVLPKTDEVKKWLDQNVGTVGGGNVPYESMGEVVAPGGQVKAVRAAGRVLAPKAGEMLGAYMQRAGLQPSLMAYHGTPYSFEKFSASRIGTGEGAQAYGFGLYFAESKGVANQYRVSLSDFDMYVDGKPFDNNNPAHRAAFEVKQFGGDSARKDLVARYKSQIADLRSRNQKWANELASSKEAELPFIEGGKLPKYTETSKGNLYTVNIPDAVVAKMLDFDAPIGSQSKEIQALARQYNLQPDDLGGDLLAAADGKTAAGAQRLREAGIPGVRYLDQGSRKQGEGTRNIVVFPGGEDQVKILKKEGKQ